MNIIKKSAVLGTAIAGLLVTSTGSAHAASGLVGPHYAADVSCNTSVTPTLQVHSPYIRATYDPRSSVWVGPNNLQWVGFRVWLLRWNGQAWAGTDQDGDGYIDRSAIMQAEATSEEGGPMAAPEQWYNTATKKWQPGTRFFPIRYRGSYKVRVEYFWYADTHTSGGYDVLDSVNHYSPAGWSASASAWCQY